MRTTGQSFVQIALASLALLPSLISTQQAADPTHYSRYYFSPIVQNNIIYILGGSDTTLDVPFLNISNGLNTNSPDWSYWSVPKTAELQQYGRGVAYQNNNNNIYVQGGNGTTTTIESLVNFIASTGSWRNASTIGITPPVTNMMTANVNPSDNIAYYYGGQPIKNHAVDITKTPVNTFYSFNTNTNVWAAVTPSKPSGIRPGRIDHTSNIINNQMFIMGGVTYGANPTTKSVEADFESVLVYDISNNTAISVATLGDIPAARQAYSTALGLDGKSIVLYGGYFYDGTAKYNPAPSDVYILDTCTLTWRKQSVGGTAPGALFSHNAVNINNYMVILIGKTDPATFNTKTYILDMNQWKWVTSIDASSLGNTVAQGSCQFALPSVTSTNFVEFNYDYSVLDNPLRPATKKSNSKSLGLGLGITALVLCSIGVFIVYRRISRKRSRTLNPRWMRNIPTQINNSFSNDRDYPLFVYNKELDNKNTNNPNRPVNNNAAFAPHGVRTYTASDHEQWEQQLNEEAENPQDGQTTSRHSDIWKRMRGLNDAPVISDEEVQQNRSSNNNNNSNAAHGKLLDL